jgi:hypothetical protein
MHHTEVRISTLSAMPDTTTQQTTPAARDIEVTLVGAGHCVQSVELLVSYPVSQLLWLGRLEGPVSSSPRKQGSCNGDIRLRGSGLAYAEWRIVSYSLNVVVSFSASLNKQRRVTTPAEETCSYSLPFLSIFPDTTRRRNGESASIEKAMSYIALIPKQKNPSWKWFSPPVFTTVDCLAPHPLQALLWSRDPGVV